MCVGWLVWVAVSRTIGDTEGAKESKESKHRVILTQVSLPQFPCRFPGIRVSTEIINPAHPHGTLVSVIDTYNKCQWVMDGIGSPLPIHTRTGRTTVRTASSVQGVWSIVQPDSSNLTFERIRLNDDIQTPARES